MDEEVDREEIEEIEETQEVIENDDRTPVEEVATEEEPVEDEWKPDYSFKVMDKEHEFDDFIKPILNKDNYEKVKDLYQKAYGIDFVKSRKNELEEEVKSYKTIEDKYNQQNQSLGYLGNLIATKDYHTLFNELKIPDQEIMKYSLDRVNYHDLPEDQRREYDNNLETKQRVQTLERQNQEFYTQMQQNATQARLAELDNSLSSGQMASIVSEFDGRVGKPGAFKEEVIRRGQMAYYSTGKDIPVQEAVNEVARLYGTSGGSTNTANVTNPPIQQKTVMTSNKPVIPNIKSGGHSPARKLPTSIDDLKKAAAAYN